MIKRVFGAGKLIRHSKNLRFREFYLQPQGVDWEPLIVMTALLGTIFYMIRSSTPDPMHL